MAKRMIDTELWNDEKIIEYFTAEDKYFWLYLLTSPSCSICGVLKYSPARMARDTGLHKDTIANLVYRFKRVHKLIALDETTDEIVILNWGNYNWTKSNDLAKTIEKQAQAIQSERLRWLVLHNLSDKLRGTVLPPSQDGTNTIIYNIEDTNNTKVNIESKSNNTSQLNNSTVSIESIREWFEIVYRLYPRKVSKVQGKQTFEHKFVGMSEEEARQKVKAVKKMLEAQVEEWQGENGGLGRKSEYTPHISSWLNDNVEDSPHYKRGKR